MGLASLAEFIAASECPTSRDIRAILLAKATGQNTNLAPELAGQLLIGAEHAISPAFRSPEGNPFGEEQPAPTGANNADQLAAFLGRKV